MQAYYEIFVTKSEKTLIKTNFIKKAKFTAKFANSLTSVNILRLFGLIETTTINWGVLVNQFKRHYANLYKEFDNKSTFCKFVIFVRIIFFCRVQVKSTIQLQAITD